LLRSLVGFASAFGLAPSMARIKLLFQARILAYIFLRDEYTPFTYIAWPIIILRMLFAFKPLFFSRECHRCRTFLTPRSTEIAKRTIAAI
jgi:hypothetical protein